MLTDLDRLEYFLGTAGSADIERTNSRERLASSLFRREFGRDPSEQFQRDLSEKLDFDRPTDEFVGELRSSMEWFIRSARLIGSQSESYRRLSARAMSTEDGISPQVISECIACYRLILGREPDESGFDHFVDFRSREGLSAMVMAFLGSAEAAHYFRPGPPPRHDVTVLTVSSAAISILNAAGSDAALGALSQMRGSIDYLVGRLESIGHSIERLAELAQMRFDGDSTAR